MKTADTFAGSPRAITGQVARAAEIATVLSGKGLGWLVQAAGVRGCVSPRCRLACAKRPGRKCEHHLGADVPPTERLRLTLISRCWPRWPAASSGTSGAWPASGPQRR